MENHSEEKAMELFNKLFSSGFAGEDVFASLAPAGWGKSDLFFCFHPTVEQRYEEAMRIHNNLGRLKKKKEAKEDNLPTMEEIKMEYKEEPVEPKIEMQELIGYCLWDIFSDNHEVMDEKGIYEIGSFRGAAGFIADYLNRLSDENKYDYMDFYMGSIWIRSRADLSSVYHLIFQRLKREGCHWKYYFPRMGILDLSGLKEEKEDIVSYSPEKSFLREKEKKEKRQQVKKLQHEFDKEFEKEKENLKSNPPVTVKAYLEIYGKYPLGWEE